MAESTCNVCSKTFNHKRRNIKYCSKICADKGSYIVTRTNYKNRLRYLLANARNRSVSKNLDFNLDKDYLIYLWKSNEGCCALTGKPFILTNEQETTVNPKAPTIDRIQPKLGYVKGNIRLITYHMNVALSDFGTEEFEKLARAYLTGE